MKEKIPTILNKLFFELFPYAVVFVFYRKLVGWSAALALSVVFAVYASAMVLSALGTKTLLAYERAGVLRGWRLILSSCAVASPIYFLWIILSIIPISNYNIWFLTGFPVAVISAFPLIALSEHFPKNRRVLFWCFNAGGYILSLASGQLLGRAILP